MTEKILNNSYSFNQKKINHIFHYTHEFESLQKIIENGFSPSYCKEVIDEIDYFIPMVSFCNIPLKDVGLYMHYGDYGIGLQLDWAIRNSISPVVYIHENTPFKSLHRKINEVLIRRSVDEALMSKINHNQTLNETNQLNQKEEFEFIELLKTINDITVPALQFFKNWKTTYKGKEILTYQEREWRFIPNLAENKRIITSIDSEYKQLKEETFKKTKPHFPDFSLKIDSIENLKYIIVKTKNERKKVLDLLINKFGDNSVINAVLSGNLLIITKNIIHDDF